MMLAGLAGLYPVMWFDVMVGLVAVTHTLKLLITGVPILGHISEERGFMFSMSVVTVGLCVLVAVLAITVILWASVTPPVFIR